MKQTRVINKLLLPFCCGLRCARSVAVLALLNIGSAGYAQRSVVHDSRISTLQVVAANNWQSMPVVALGKGAVNISFDDLTHEYRRYAYKIVHCDATWNPSTELFASDYISGFNGELTIDDYDESLNTNCLYMHYRLRIPNENCRITMSGNYKLMVYDEDDGGRHVLTACFMVVEPQVKVAASYTSNTDVDINKSHQQVVASVDFGDIRVTDPTRQLNVVFLQNGRWDSAVRDPKPDYVSGDGLKWVHNRQLVFSAGNVYRKFEMLDMNHTTMGLEKMTWDGKNFHAFVFPDLPRLSYVHDEAPQGAFYIRNSDNEDNDFLSDYAWVHFRLAAPRQNGDVYVNGDWTHDSFQPSYKMSYEPEKGEYEGAVFLKQGYYSYQYLVLQDDGTAVPVTSEGSYFQTANKYQVLVYYRGQADRADRLVGYVEVK